MSQIHKIKNYRPDIDGLRSIAVLFVIIHHAFPNQFLSGFIGVDIFFVISGYLISRLIIEDLIHKKFSILDFYLRRIRRIFPAMVLVLLSTFITGWLTLNPIEFSSLGKHLAAGAGYIANIVSWKESGYFDSTSNIKPLLHLWSLGVEEQFYFVWPVLLLLAWKKKLNLLFLIIILSCISFFININQVYKSSSAVFYLPHTRFWEFLTGSALAFFSLLPHYPSLRPRSFSRFFLNDGSIKRIISTIISFLGFLIILFGAMKITPQRYFPGWWAISPVLGSALIILAGNQSWLNRKLLANRIMVGVGLISYPLYLWHWPALAFGRIYNGAAPSWYFQTLLILISFILAYLTFNFVEKPLRFNKTFNQVELKLFLATIFICALGLLAYQSILKPRYKLSETIISAFNRTPSEEPEQNCFDISNNHKDNYHPWFCHLNAKGKKAKFFVTGDSHALSMISIIRKIAMENGTDILFTGYSGCPPLIGVKPLRGDQDIRNCFELNNKILNFVKDNGITDVFLIGRWNYYTVADFSRGNHTWISFGKNASETLASTQTSFTEGIRNTFLNYTNAGIKVHIMAQIPRQQKDPIEIYGHVFRFSRDLQNRLDNHSVPFNKHLKEQEFTSKVIRNESSPYADKVEIVNLDSIYCNNRFCSIGDTEAPYYIDDNHLNLKGASRSYEHFLKIFSR